ncbi:MAG: VWA domain-containing protein [Chromatiales bacterium]|jgi:hypothetical protein|nr:VWA domain-containing protein [Chromatiales bacterium]
MSNNDRPLSKKSTRSDIDAFVHKMASVPAQRAGGRCGRLIFALDATASRQLTWDQACHIQAEMFEQTAQLGGLEIQLCYFRGFREFEVSAWTKDALALRRMMTTVDCRAGHTQIERVLKHAAREAGAKPVDALIYVGDSMEESFDTLAHEAGRLGLLKIPVFMFHEGSNAIAARVFAEIARLSGGACCAFDAGSAEELRVLLGAVAIYAAGGRKALADYSQSNSKRNSAVQQILHQLPGPSGAGEK